MTFSAFVVPGFESLEAVAQWAAARSREQVLTLGAWVHPFDGSVAPLEKTIRWILTTVDPDALVSACVAWTLAHDRAGIGVGAGAGVVARGEAMAARLTALAMDGECAHGARTGDGVGRCS